MHTERESVDLVGDDVVTRVARAAMIAALMGATAYVAIPYPLSPAPVTLQIVVVFLAGLALGPIWGTFTLVVYLLAGALGAPVFSGGGAGIGHLFGPTGGYLFSFPLAAMLIGAAVHRGGRLRTPSSVPVPILVLALACGMCLIYAGGTYYYAWLQGTSLAESAAIMVVPFVPADILKIGATVLIVRSGVLDLR